MTKELLEKEFEIRKLKEINKQLMNTNTILNRQYKNLNEHIDKRINEEVNKKVKIIEKETKKENKNKETKPKINTRGLYKDYEELLKKYKELEKANKYLMLRADIAEDNERRAIFKNQKLLQMILSYKKELNLKDETIKELTASKEKTSLQIERLLAKLNLNGANAGIPTSQTPINQNKPIPNGRVKTGKTKGGQKGHRKSKLEKFKDDEITEKIDVTLEECPECHEHNLISTGKVIEKDEYEYRIITVKKRYYFYVYKCPDCGKIVRQKIPVNLKEENQYGPNVQSTILSLVNVGNVTINKAKRIMEGLTINEMSPSEGYISKLQKRASSKLDNFIKDLKAKIPELKIIHWDDTVIFVYTKRACMRYYGDDKIALYTAHPHKNKEGLDEDRILALLDKNNIVVHDHNKVNYNDEYNFTNAECMEHLKRDLQKVIDRIPNRTWCKELKTHIQNYIHLRNEKRANNIEEFSEEEINDYFIGLDQGILKGLEENEKDSKPYYAETELTLLHRIMKYRDNYSYWVLDFDIPATNNTAERALRGVKSKMKASGQFENIEHARYYANIRSYIETCYRNGINEFEALTRLLNDNPYTLDEILNYQKNSD